MAIDIKFDLAGNPESPTIILANRNGNKLGQLDVDVNSIDLSDNFNDASEFTFTLNKYVDGVLTHLWDNVVDFKLVYCKEWDMWFEIKVELDESAKIIKTVFCTQLGQAELSQIMLYNIEINTEDDIARDDYKISILYDENDPEASILNRVLYKAPHYSIAYVDPTIAKIQRSFSFDGTSIYDAFQEIAEEIGCLFVYNSNSDEYGKIQRTISVYDLQQNCNDCGYRGEYTDKCPKCGSANIKNGYGEDTLIFVTSDELASSGIQLVTDTDSVKNCFKLEAGDDLMTATVRNCNPNGTDYIWYFSENIKEDMSDELVEKINSYDEKYKQYYDEYISDIDIELSNAYNALVDKYSVYNDTLQKITTPVIGYASLMNAYYNVVDMSLYLKSLLMPSIEMSETSAEEQIGLLTSSSLSPVAVTNITTASLPTVNSAVLSMAKIIIKPTYKVQIGESELLDNGDTKIWNGNFIITNYSDEEDTVVGNVVSVEVNDDLETFIRQKIEKALNKGNTDDLSISGLFKKEYDDFCNELKKYALNPLINFRDVCQTCIDILIEQGVGDGSTWGDTEEGSEGNLYENLYTPYYNKLMAIEAEIKTRENEINIISGKYDVDGNLIEDGLQTNIEKCKMQIQDSLNFENYLGNELWLEFCTYRREDKYSNENYISDGLDNAELFKRALEFFDVAENEIYKSSELQHSISTTLNNLLAIPKFEKLVKSFKVGNWIRVQIDDKIFKLRLLKYDISYGSFNNIPVEFSDVTKIKNGITDVDNILSQASSMATTYSAIQRQASQGNDAQNTIENWISDGLNTALIRIQNNNSEDITITKNGLLGRSYNEITDTYSPEQIKLTHNIMAYTDDNWKTVKQAVGKHNYIEYNPSSDNWESSTGYGISAEFVTSGQVMGSKIVGGEIYSSNYHKGTYGSDTDVMQGTRIDLKNGDFELGNGKISYSSRYNILTLNGVTIEWDSTNAPSTSDIDGLSGYLDQLDSNIGALGSDIVELELYFNQLDGRIQTYSQTEDPSINWSDAEKNKHIGDLWFNPDDGLTKRWNGSSWETVTDSELTELIQTKAQIFTSTPIPPYYVGDLWLQGYSGDIKHCVQERLEGESFNPNDWQLSSKYTDDTSLNDFIDGEFADELRAINEQVDKKAETWYQDTDPSLAWTTEDLKKLHVGDLWFNTIEKKNYIYDYTYQWLESDGIPDEVFDAIDGKSTIYVSQPSSQELGDLLIPAVSFAVVFESVTYEFKEAKVYRCTETSPSFIPSRWVEINYTDDTVAREALEMAKQAIDDAAEGIRIANQVGSDAKEYIDSEIFKLDEAVSEYLGWDGSTIINGRYVIAPYLGGGYLNITNTENGSRVIVDPNNLTGNNYIFQVYDGEKVTVGVDSSGNASFSGIVSATGGSIGGFSLIDNTLSVEDENVYIKPSYTEAMKILDYYSGNIELTDNELKASDLDANGLVNTIDAMLINQIINGTKEYHDCVGSKVGKVKAVISPKNPEKLINIVATNAWGREVNSYFGADGLKTTNINAEYISIDGNYVEVPVILYNNDIGTNGTVTLNESADKFKRICIVVGDTSDNICGSLTVYSPNNKTVNISASKATSSGVSIDSVRYVISGKTMVPSNGYKSQYSNNAWTNNGSNLYCKYVIGFKGGL